MTEVEVDSLHSEFGERFRLRAVLQSVLDAIYETLVVFFIRGTLVEARDCSISVGFNAVPGDMMMVFHSQVVQFVGGGIHRICFIEMHFRASSKTSRSSR